NPAVDVAAALNSSAAVSSMRYIASATKRVDSFSIFSNVSRSCSSQAGFFDGNCTLHFLAVLVSEDSIALKQFDAQIVPIMHYRGHACRAASHEGIEHNIPRV